MLQFGSPQQFADIYVYDDNNNNASSGALYLSVYLLRPPWYQVPLKATFYEAIRSRKEGALRIIDPWQVAASPRFSALAQTTTIITVIPGKVKEYYNDHSKLE